MWRVVFVGLALGAGCLPADPPEFRRDAGTKLEPTRKKRRTVDAGRPDTPRARAPREKAQPAPLLTAEFRDDFERDALGPDWKATSSAWRVEAGKLCGERARNHPVWLQKRLPRNARIEFTATSDSPDGDIKCEVWGDGSSAATGTSYVDATSYIVVFGGWKNSLHVLARLDEHGSDRKETRLVPGSEALRTRPVVQGRSYRFTVERSDGRSVRFSVDGTLIHVFADPEPLFGPGHEYFGFNDWHVRVCFDDVVVTPLEG